MRTARFNILSKKLSKKEIIPKIQQFVMFQDIPKMKNIIPILHAQRLIFHIPTPMTIYTIARSRERIGKSEKNRYSSGGTLFFGNKGTPYEKGRKTLNKNSRNKKTTDKIINPTNIFMPMGLLDLMVYLTLFSLSI
jgi:hypothetical protein